MAIYREQDKRPLLLSVLRGSFMFAGDVAKEIDPVPPGLAFDFIRASSYGEATTSSGTVTIESGRLKEEGVRGRHVLLLEDIVDTGLTCKR